MIPKWPHVRLARMTLELATPLSITSGAFDPIYDMPLALDANGLPTIPGTSLAGVLRAALPAQQRGMFGELEHSARLEFSFSRIHDSHDRPVDGLKLDRRSLWRDPILRPLLTTPPRRHHVRLNEYGTAADTGKFDRCIVPGGHRFSCELRLWSATQDEGRLDWDALKTQLANPPRLGGGTRGGLGRFRVQRWLEGQFDLTSPADFERWIRISRRLDAEPLGLAAETIAADDPGDDVTLVLRPVGGWRIGDGSIPLGQGREPDRLPLVEEWIDWTTETGQPSGHLQPVVVIPGSGIKGALRHRTDFHLCRLQGWFAESEGYEAERDLAKESLEQLFGVAPQSADVVGQAGRLCFEDIRLDCETAAPKTYPHNSIDRFSQGGRRGRLFSEEVLTGRSEWRIRIGVADMETVEPEVRQAFLLALDDLAGGALAVGAGAAKGQGFLEPAEPIDWCRIRERLQIMEDFS